MQIRWNYYVLEYVGGLGCLFMNQLSACFEVQFRLWCENKKKNMGWKMIYDGNYFKLTH